MSKEKIYIFDTTLRDGAQTEGVNFSIDDKNKIARALSNLGVDYLEGGWPGANTLDTTFFNNPPKLENTILTAFGMTKKTGRSAENDPGLSALLNTSAPAICLVGKSWDFHVDVALGISKEENLENIIESTKHFVKENKEFMFDAEHFFDGFKNNKDYAISCVKSAYDNGARWIVLCDTNGGTLPDEVEKIVREITKHVPGKNLGIHAHNDTGNAVANSLAAVSAGARHVQGTINGIGERCGNANLMSFIPTIHLKEYFSKNFSTNIKSENKSVLLAAADTFRAAATEQLKIWGERNNVKVVSQISGSDPGAVIFDALQSARANNIDVLIVDTAGRLHNKKNLIDEIKKISEQILLELK